jgi:hypothetical protein
MLRSLLRAARSCSRRCATSVCTRDRGVGRSDCAAFTPLSAGNKRNLKIRQCPANRQSEGRREFTH